MQIFVQNKFFYILFIKYEIMIVNIGYYMNVLCINFNIINYNSYDLNFVCVDVLMEYNGFVMRFQFLFVGIKGKIISLNLLNFYRKLLNVVKD